MALLGMGANMQDSGYFINTEGRKWTSSNVNTELKNDCRHVGSLPVLSPCNILGCNKQLLKQTILKQEAVFRDQIHELHRIYNTQRKLMDEIRRNELCKHNLRLEVSWSSSSFSFQNAQKMCFSPNLPRSTGQSSALIDGSIQLSMASAQKKSREICPGPARTVTEASFEDSNEAKYRKIGKKILDLQLPADKYIDSEEGESSRFSLAELWKAPVSDFGQHSIAVQELPSFSYYASLNKSYKSLMKTSGFGRNENGLAKYVKGSEDVGTSKDLNLNITPCDYSDTSHRIQITHEENGLQDSISGFSWLKEKPVCDGKPPMSSDLQCLEVLPPEVFWNQSKTRSIEENERGCIFDVTSPREHVPHLGNQMSADGQNKSESLAGLIDLNSCMIEDKHKPMDVDLNAPVSPENKECSPPRGESDENQLEVLLQSAEQEDPEVREEAVKIAAEALVSISGFVDHDSLQMTTCSSSEYFLSNPLNWFAGIVSRTVNHLETGSRRSVGKNALARGRKQSYASTSNNTNLKKLTNSTKLGIEKKGLTSWGKASRKRRGQRVPTTNLKFILRSI